MANADDSVPSEAASRMVGVTPNQIVAYNIAYWRKAAGLTQEELGERLGGWSKNAVSAAERSWDGRRIRQFDADELVAVAAALGIPLLALFLPPEADENGHRYVLKTSQSEESPDPWSAKGMVEMFADVMPDPHLDTPVMAAYRERLRVLVNSYTDDRWGRQFAQRLSAAAEHESFHADLSGRAVLAAQIERLNWQYQAVQALAEDLGSFLSGLRRRQEATNND